MGRRPVKDYPRLYVLGGWTDRSLYYGWFFPFKDAPKERCLYVGVHRNVVYKEADCHFTEDGFIRHMTLMHYGYKRIPLNGFVLDAVLLDPKVTNGT